MHKDFKIVKTQIYPLGVYFRHAGLHIAAVHRRIHTDETAEFGIILYDRKHRGGVRIPFPEENRVGSVYAMLLEGYQNREFSYLFYCGDRTWPDPYCRKIECNTKYGVPGKGPIRCMVPDAHYDWEEDRAPGIPYENTILYALHVRGFTKHRSFVLHSLCPSRIHSFNQDSYRSRGRYQCFVLFLTSALPLKADFGLISSSGERVLPHFSHWSPYAPSEPHFGQVPVI